MSDHEIPRYRAVMDVFPSPKARHRHEPPFATVFDPSVWQYGTAPLKATEEISTTAWPHPSFRPLNEPAKRVLAYFNSRMKSRLPVSPFRYGELFLDDGLTGPAQPQVKMRVAAAGDAA
jgi:hypothetical protein